MSSTNRGYERHKTDYYVTPKNAIKEFLSEWLQDEKDIGQRPDRIFWLDPCAGGDAKNDMSYASVIKEAFDPNVLDTIDIREDSKADMKEDYMLTDMKNKYDVIITNPPFFMAKEIIIKALEDVKEDGYVVMLLRLNFLGSKNRKSFFEENIPKRIYVHHKRMSFTKDKSTDSVEYAHFVWQKGYKFKDTKLKII